MAGEPNTELFGHWLVFKDIYDQQRNEIKFFHAFQTYTGDEIQRMASAMFVTSKDEVFAVGHNNEDNLLALTGNDFAKIVELKKPRKIVELSGKNVRKITVSERFGAALTEDGKLFYWGTTMKALQHEANDRKYVELPHEPRENFKIRDMACGAHSITFLTDENRVLIWGCINLYYSQFYNFADVPLRKNVEATGLATGWYHSAILDQKGQVWTFRYGSVGQLGYRPEDGNYLTPRKVILKSPCTKVECGAYSTLFLLKNGELYACGSNADSDHFCVGKTGYVITPAKVLLEDSVSDIAATYAWSRGKWQSLFSAASKDGTKYFKWGDDRKMEIPKTSEGARSFLDVFANFKTPQSVGELVRISLIELVDSVFKLTSPDTLPNRSILDRWSIFDALDVDLKRNVSDFTVFERTIEGSHVFGAFIKTNTDDVYSWGCNSEECRELGLQSDELISLMTPAKVETLSGKKIKKIIFNFDSGFGLSDGGSLYTWGAGSGPELENHLKGKSVIDLDSGLKFFVYLLDNAEVRLNGTISSDFVEEKHRNIYVPGKEKPVGLAAGAWHFLILTDASNVYAFGDGTYGQLGSSTWEKNEKSPLKGVKIISGPCNKIMCGTVSSFFLTDEGELYACGYNVYADPLGVGHAKEVTSPERVKVDEKVEDIAAVKKTTLFGGWLGSFALKTTSGKIYKWEGGIVKPEVVAGARLLVEAFEDEIIPHSLSLVRLSSAISDANDDSAADIDLHGVLALTGSFAKNLYGDPLYSDVTIKLRDGVIPGHKVLLHTESAFFRNALSSNEVVNRNEMDLVSYNPKAVRALLKYIYDIPIGHRASSLGDVQDFLELAEKDGNPDLVKKAEEIVLMNVVFDMYLPASTGSTDPPSEPDSEEEIQEFIESSIFP